jgi:Na+-driven multidrug efflux pump
MSNRNPFVVGAIGIGQAGTNIAQTFIQSLGVGTDYLVSINLSQDDFIQAQAALVSAANRLHLDENAYGAGKTET